jgi:hypothetical protein
MHPDWRRNDRHSHGAGAMSASRYFRWGRISEHTVFSDLVSRISVECLRACDQWFHSLHPLSERYFIVSINIQTTNHSSYFALTGLVPIKMAVRQHILKPNSSISGSVYTLESSFIAPIRSTLQVSLNHFYLLVERNF